MRVRGLPGMIGLVALAVVAAACERVGGGGGGECGDGTVDTGEQCDDGNVTAGDGCSATCTNEGAGPVCGDGTVDSGEQCDDGNLVGGDGCSAGCMNETPPHICGDGTIDADEQCDDGNSNSGDGCSSDCQVEIPPANCGNGIFDSDEECDDGNNSSFDGCDGFCQLEGQKCDIARVLGCNTSHAWNTNSLGATDKVGSYSCGGGPYNGREYGYHFDNASGMGGVGQVVYLHLNPEAVAANEVIVVLDGSSGSTCSADTCVNLGGAEVAFYANPGVDYSIVVDGVAGAAGPYTITAECPVCGNSVIETGENCDDGNVNWGDGCNGVCQLEYCGNGYVEPTESCDDGNTMGGDGCGPMCQVEPVMCMAMQTITCGGTVTGSTLDATASDVMNIYGCVPSWPETGHEQVYQVAGLTPGTMTATLSGLTVDLDVFITAPSCSTTSCVGFGNDVASTPPGMVGMQYYVVVDGYNGAEGSYTLTLSCGLP